MRPPPEDFSWGPSYSFEETRQKEALEAFREFVKKAPKSLFTKSSNKKKVVKSGGFFFLIRRCAMSRSIRRSCKRAGCLLCKPHKITGELTHSHQRRKEEAKAKLKELIEAGEPPTCFLAGPRRYDE